MERQFQLLTWPVPVSDTQKPGNDIICESFFNGFPLSQDSQHICYRFVWICSSIKIRDSLIDLFLNLSQGSLYEPPVSLQDHGVPFFIRHNGSPVFMVCHLTPKPSFQRQTVSVVRSPKIPLEKEYSLNAIAILVLTFSDSVSRLLGCRSCFRAKPPLLNQVIMKR